MAKENVNHSIILGVGAVVFKDDCVLLVKRKNPPNENQWAIPGGKVKFGEPLKEAAAREVKEETDVVIQVTEPTYTFEVINDDQHIVVIDYAAEYLSGEPTANDDALSAAWVSRGKFTTIDVNKITIHLLKEKYHFP